MRIRYKSSTERAYEVLLLNQQISIPINPSDIKLDNIIIKVFSMQEWTKLHNISLDELTVKGKCENGYTEFYKTNGVQYAFIFYNTEIDSIERQRFTIAHEIGHIALGHKECCDEYETEADTFASQLLLPHCILEKLVRSGKIVTETYLQKTFGLSKQASSISLKNVGNKIDKQAIAEYEDIILKMFDGFIKNETRNTKYYYDDEADLMDQKRNDWLNEI